MKSGFSLAASAPSFSSAVAISFSVIGQVLGQKVYPSKPAAIRMGADHEAVIRLCGLFRAFPHPQAAAAIPFLTIPIALTFATASIAKAPSSGVNSTYGSRGNVGVSR
jgi:hypothetical protein